MQIIGLQPMSASLLSHVRKPDIAPYFFLYRRASCMSSRLSVLVSEPYDMHLSGGISSCYLKVVVRCQTNLHIF